jgi:hypothetical protein
MTTPVHIETVVGEDGVIQIRAQELTPDSARRQLSRWHVKPLRQHSRMRRQPSSGTSSISLPISQDSGASRQLKGVDAYGREERDSWDL